MAAANLASVKRPIKNLNISGSPADRRWAMASAAASDEPVDVLVGDWMSELNMPTRAYGMKEGLSNGQESYTTRINMSNFIQGYEQSFLEALEPAIDDIAKKGIKLVSNAGVVSTRDLYDTVVAMVSSEGLDLLIAWVEGDVVLDTVQTAIEDGTNDFVNFISRQKLKDWPFKPIFAQCYLGGMGIATVLREGADIVICGRVADASTTLGAAIWWHDWSLTDYDQLARALIAGHMIECSTYCSGGKFTGFKAMDWTTITNIGFPFATVAFDGDVIISKQRNTGDLVSRETCKEHLLYEIQGRYYYDSDVIAKIDQAMFTAIGENEVRLTGITGLAPPPFTKSGITAHRGYRAEIHYCLVGLDIEEKGKLLEAQLRESFDEGKLRKFTKWDFTVNGSVSSHPRKQAQCIVDARLVAQTPDAHSLSIENFCRPALDCIMKATQHQRTIKNFEQRHFKP